MQRGGARLGGRIGANLATLLTGRVLSREDDAGWTRGRVEFFIFGLLKFIKVYSFVYSMVVNVFSQL